MRWIVDGERHKFDVLPAAAGLKTVSGNDELTANQIFSSDVL